MKVIFLTRVIIELIYNIVANKIDFGNVLNLY